MIDKRSDPDVPQPQPDADDGDMLILLKCTRCTKEAESLRLMEFTKDEGSEVVRCDRCGKKHSTDSLHAVDPDDLNQVDMPDPEPQATGKTR